MFLFRSTPAHEADDRELLQRMRRGHEPSARALWERHASRLIAIAGATLRGSRAPADAHDVVQGVLCQLLELSRDRIAAIEDVPAFLTRSVRNAALNHVRSAGRLDAHARRAAAPAPPDAPRLDQPSDALDRALALLDPDDRELIVLKHAGGLTFDQLAATLEANRSTLATRYRAAIDHLRRELLRDSPAGAGSAPVPISLRGDP
ncbi:MAG: RNA polymerase sigma factor [Phycisphaerales bacterium]